MKTKEFSILLVVLLIECGKSTPKFSQKQLDSIAEVKKDSLQKERKAFLQDSLRTADGSKVIAGIRLGMTKNEYDVENKKLESETGGTILISGIDFTDWEPTFDKEGKLQKFTLNHHYGTQLYKKTDRFVRDDCGKTVIKQFVKKYGLPDQMFNSKMLHEKCDLKRAGYVLWFFDFKNITINDEAYATQDFGDYYELSNKLSVTISLPTYDKAISEKERMKKEKETKQRAKQKQYSNDL